MSMEQIMIAKMRELKNKVQREELEDISIELLQENPYQPRIEIKSEEVQELANSIQENGLLQPILVAIIHFLV